MTVVTAMWGIHNDALGAELFDRGFVSVGWDEVGDLTQIGPDQTAMKATVARAYPEAKPGAVPGWASILVKFGFTMHLGDQVVAAYKRDRTLNFGVVHGPYEFHPEVPQHRHRRRVRWVKLGVPRNLFPQAALFEIGSAITLFQVRRHADVFGHYFDATSDDTFVQQVAAQHAEPDTAATWAAEEPDADRIDQATRDYIEKSLLSELSPEEFESFTADLLRAMGYQARVTQFSGDGGVDVIAHKDPLGLEPPIIKVQCKQIRGTNGGPDVQRLIGTLASGESGLFVSTGTYSRDALDLERSRQNLRLLSRTDVVDMTLRYYAKLDPQWQARMPLRKVWVVDRPLSSG